MRKVLSCIYTLISLTLLLSRQFLSHHRRNKTAKDKDDGAEERKSRPTTPATQKDPVSSLLETDTMRMLAEV